MAVVSLSYGQVFNLQPSRVRFARQAIGDDEAKRRLTHYLLGMVAFYVAFLALRSQDAGHPVEDIRDYELDGEREIYGG
jgi:hypothetical protein